MKEIKRVVICIMGKSACGKSTILRTIKGIDNCGAVNLVKSFTTRGIRYNDPYDEETHTYVTEDKFIEDRDNGKIMSLYNSPNGYHSWITDESFVYDRMNFMAIDIKAFNKLVEEKQEEFIIKGFYLDIDEEERKRRYVKRNGSISGFSNEEHLALPVDYNKEVITKIDCNKEIEMQVIMRELDKFFNEILINIFKYKNGELPYDTQEFIQNRLQELEKRG